MIRKPFNIGVLIACLLMLTGCFIFDLSSKKDRIVMRASSDLREKEIMLYARYEGTQTGTHVTLRKENFFELYSHSAFGWSYYSGTWNYLNNSDTIVLNYMYDHTTNWRYAVINGGDLSLEMESLDSLKTRKWKFEVVHNTLK